MRTDKVHEIKEGLQEIRRGEGISWSVDVSAWAELSSVQDITVIREADDQDVTGEFTAAAAPTIDGDAIILPEVNIPASAALGYYRLNFPFEAGGFSPGIPFIRFLVKE